MLSETVYEATRRRAAMIDRSDRGRFTVSGPDRASYLQGLLTNDTMALAAGQGCYAAYLTPQGRMITDLFVYELGDLMLVTLPRATKDTVLGRVNQFISGEDVTITDVTDTLAQVAVLGPEAPRYLGGILEEITYERLTALPEHGNARVGFASHAAIVTRMSDAGEPGFDVFVERSQAPPLLSRLAEAGGTALDDDTAESIRIEAGVPRFGRDM